MRWRYVITLIVFFSSFVCIIGKLAYWQIAQASDLTAMGESQYAQSLEILPDRGDIRTSDGFPLATNKIAYLLYANPKVIKNPLDMATRLSPIIQVDTATLSAKLTLDKFWVPLKSFISEDEKKSLVQANLLSVSCNDAITGLGCEQETQRFYPEASTAAQLLGFVGKDENGNDQGYSGLEGFYEMQLKGRPGKASIIRDANGFPILSKLNDISTGAQDGRTLVLHIDRSIQFLVEHKLQDGIAKYGAQSGMAAVMDPKTGGILAMSSFPSFDPRTYQNYDQSLYKNPLITDTYEPGSTFKPLVMAAALNEKLITPQTECPICGGPVAIGGYQIHTWNDQYFANTTMTDVMIHSDNTGMVYVSKQLGINRMIDYLNKYGIGDVTNIDLQGEFAPDIKSADNFYPIDAATAAFGQGISVTPIELLDAFSSIADNGKRMEPHVVSQIITPDGQTITIPPKQVDQPISDETSKVMTEILVQAVDKGEAKWARLHGYRIAGKTGTASIPLNGHYDPTKTIASFIGFAPADNPKFVMLVILDKPTASIYGAETAAPIWFDIAKDLLTYYGIAPTGGDESGN